MFRARHGFCNRLSMDTNADKVETLSEEVTDGWRTTALLDQLLVSNLTGFEWKAVVLERSIGTSPPEKPARD